MNVLAIGAHPADVEMHCGGTLAKYAAEGHRIAIAVVCDGSGGLRRLPVEEARREREREVRQAAKLIGAETFHLHYPDHMIPMDNSVLLRMTDVLRQVRANVVITHDPNDCFVDHQRTNKLVEEAIYLVTQDRVETGHAPSPYHPTLFYLDTVTGLSFQPTDYVDVTEVMDSKRKMIECHQSQLELTPQYSDEPTIMEMTEVSARFRGIQCGVRYAEAFRQQLKWDRTMTWRVLP